MDLLEEMSKIDSYLFHYKKDIQNKYPDGMYGVDDDNHVGVMAQELKENPITAPTVKENEDGYLTVDTQQLTMAITAICSDISKRVLALEETVNKIKDFLGVM